MSKPYNERVKARTATERSFKRARAEINAERIAERRANGEDVKSPSANRKKRKHGR